MRADQMGMHMRTTLALVALLAGCATVAGPGTPSTGVLAGGAARPGSEEDLVANVGDRVFFDFQRWDLQGREPLTQKNFVTLDRQAAWLMQYAQNDVQIAGNCDERGTEEYNLALGQRRADTTRAYLVAKSIAGERISAISYGKERPTALGSAPDAWAQNRNAITSVR